MSGAATNDRPRIAIIGLGKMGSPIARRLLSSGHEVHGFNRSPAAARALAADGLRPAGSAADAAAAADVVLTALPTLDDVRQVFIDLAPACRQGQLYVDHSTVSPGLSRWCAEAVGQHGAGFLDAPVSGGPEGAADGTLTIMAGGDESDFGRVLPVLETYGRTIRRCGGVGAGQAVKLVNQLLVGVHSAAIAEAAVFGTALGVDAELLAELLPPSYGGSVMVGRNIPRMLTRDFGGATSVNVLLKDLAIITDEAAARAAPLPLGAVAVERFLDGRARGFGDEDIAGLVRLWEEAAGVVVGHVEQPLATQEDP